MASLIRRMQLAHSDHRMKNAIPRNRETGRRSLGFTTKIHFGDNLGVFHDDAKDFVARIKRQNNHVTL